MVGGDEVQEIQEGNAQGERQEKMLTEDVIKEIKEEVDKKESGDILVVLLKKTIDTIIVEKFFETNTKMNELRSSFSHNQWSWLLVCAKKEAGFLTGAWRHVRNCQILLQ